MTRRRPVSLLAWAWLAALLLLVACHAPVELGARPAGSATSGPSGSTPYPEGSATLRIAVVWPRQIQSIPPSADTITIATQLPAGLAPLAPIAPLLRSPSGGIATTRSVTVPADVPVKLQATATATGSVLAQSEWLTIVAKRNQSNDVPLELLPATGSSPASATFLAPEIDQVTPDRGYPGLSTVTLTGANFGFSQGYGSVLFDTFNAGGAQLWTDDGSGASNSATISVIVPPGPTDGQIQVHLGATGAETATYTGSFTPGDPWSGHFNVLGPIGATLSLATDVISDNPAISGYATSSAQPHGMADTLLASDGSTFWAFWVGGSSSGAKLEAEVLSPNAQNFTHAVTAGAPFTIDAPATGTAILLGGEVSDGSGIWLTWTEDTGTVAKVMLARISTSGVALGPFTLSTTAMPSTVPVFQGPPAVYTSAQPAIALNSSGTGLVVWIDDRDSQGNIPVPRVYGMTFAQSNGATLTSATAIQQSNDPGLNLNTSNVYLPSRPSVASDGQNFLVAWQEAPQGQDFELMAQGISAAGAAESATNNIVSQALSSISLEDPQLAWASGSYAVFYVGQPDLSADSSLYFQILDSLGRELQNGQSVLPVTISDDTRAQGIDNCPSYTPGVPCGQGFRMRPQVVWNGRDYMTAWEMHRNDGDIDVVGARLQANGLRAPEEPSSPAVTGGQRSVAEILFSFEPGQPAISEAGTQIQPRLAFAGDVELVGWLEAGADPSHLTFMGRLWR